MMVGVGWHRMLLLKNVSLGSLSELNLDSWLYQEFVNKIIRVSPVRPVFGSVFSTS